ncbi:MAG: cache domain-containing protein [Magnetococcales bacterium]|nr:cache domain-containing protein [Magnetococcales bacterium]
MSLASSSRNISALLGNMRIRWRLALLVILSLLSMAIISLLLLRSLHTQLMVGREDKVHDLVESTAGILSHFHKQAVRGEISAEEAKSRALAVIRELRFDKDNYFWINDMQPRMVMHPIKPELDGKDLGDFKDPAGKKLFIAFVETVKKQGAGFVPYLWPKPGAKDPVAKISYVAGFEPWGWIIGAGIYIDDVETIFWQEARYDLIDLLIAMVILSGLAMVIGRSIVVPLQEIVVLSDRLAEGDLTATHLHSSKDEIGQLAGAFGRMADALRGLIAQLVGESIHLQETATGLKGVSQSIGAASEQLSQQSRTVASATGQLSTTMQNIRQSASGANENMEVVVAATEQSRVNMQTISAAAEQASVNLSTVASATEQADNSMNQVRDAAERTASNVNTVASSVEQLTASIQDVRTRCQMANDQSQAARQRAESNFQIVEQMTESTQEIGQVVKVINSIASQTNMLALNAAIEAAGAGEAGRGFAVVANEVKTLASQTAEATQLISSKVDGIRKNALRVTHAVSEVTQAIDAISQANGEILFAVDEQSRATEEISRSMVVVSEETGEVTRRVAESTSGMNEIARSVTEISQGIGEVTRSVADAFMGIEGVKEQVDRAASETDSIARLVEEASDTSEHISGEANQLRDAAGGLEKSGHELTERARGLAKVSETLQVIISRFKV